MTQFFEGPTPSSDKGGGDSNYAAACGSLKENPPQCITVEYKLVNSKIKNMCMENKKSKELLNLHRNMAMKPQLGNSRKCPDLYWKYYPTLGQEIWKKIWKKNLKEKRKANKEVALKIGQTRSRPLLLDVCLDSKLRGLIISLKTVGAGINQHVIRGVLIVLVQPYPEKFVKYVTLK